MKYLKDRTAIVTGAASGIGLAIAEAFAARGMNVALTDLDGQAVTAAAERLRAAGAKTLGLHADVRDPDAMTLAARAAVERFGELNVAVNNAGIVNRGNSWELTLDDWHRVIDVNLWGVIHGVHAFVPHILAAGAAGHVVNVASMASVHIIPQLGPYTTAKHGVLGLSDVLRAELVEIGAPVGVSVVLPGSIKTAMNPIGTVTAAQVAANVIDAIFHDRRYVFTDDHSAEEVKTRLDSIVAARDDVI